MSVSRTRVFGPIRIMYYSILLLPFDAGRMLDGPGFWIQRGQWTVQVITWPWVRYG